MNIYTSPPGMHAYIHTVRSKLSSSLLIYMNTTCGGIYQNLPSVTSSYTKELSLTWTISV